MQRLHSVGKQYEILSAAVLEQQKKKCMISNYFFIPLYSSAQCKKNRKVQILPMHESLFNAIKETLTKCCGGLGSFDTNLSQLA